MSYLVLARKYRPRTFAEVAGQQPAVRALANALEQQRLHHAYLFTGTRGVGKTTLARILAACFNCERGVTAAPCGKCAPCSEIPAGRFIDLIEVDAASRTGVDDTRELLSNAQFLPARGRYKVYLIDEVHMLSTSSFNALLKTLEEPPAHVKFLLATTEAKRVPTTVLSRCLQFNLKNMPPDVVAAQLARVLAEEGIEAEPDALAAIGRAAAGSMRDALSIADQAISHSGGRIDAAGVSDMLGVAGRDEIGTLLDALAARDARALLAAGDELAARALNLADVLGELQSAFHDLAVARELGTAPDASYARFRDAFSGEDLQLYYQIALLGGRDMPLAPDPKTGFDMTLIRLASFEPAPASPANGRPERAAADRPVVPENADPAPMPPAPASAVPAPSSATPSLQPAVRSVPAPEPAAALPANAPEQSGAAEQTRAPNQDAAAGQTTESGQNWPALAAALPARGVTRMILDHANLLERAPGRWILLLPDSHRSLLNDAQHAEIATLASNFEQNGTAVEFRIGEPTEETPAAARARRNAETRAQAQAALMADATVQSLIAEFDGRLESASLRNSP